MGKLGFYFNQENCIGCRACQQACKDKNDLEVGILFRRVKTFETGKFPHPNVFHYAGTCNHCENPMCVKGCPTGAMYIAEDGTVQHDDDKCIGCTYCVWNCPYKVPQYIKKLGKVHKCDFCKDLREKGENPACVDACNMRVLEWGDLDELKKRHPHATKDLPILPPSSMTNPSTIIEARECALESHGEEFVQYVPGGE